MAGRGWRPLVPILALMSLVSNWRRKRTELDKSLLGGSSSMKRIAIIGAGGFAREVAWLLEDISAATSEEASRYTPVGFLVSDASRIGPYDSPILGDFSWLESNHVDALAIGIGTPAVRLKLSEELKERFPHIAWPELIHPSVKWQRRTMRVGEGVIICAGA